MNKEEEQREKRQKLIPVGKAVVQLKIKTKEYQFVFYVCIIIGFFLLAGGMINQMFSVLIGIVLIGGGLFFSKKQNDYLLNLKDDYGI